MSTHSKKETVELYNGIKIRKFSNQAAPIDKPLQRKALGVIGKAHKLSIQRTDMKAAKIAGNNSKYYAKKEYAKNKEKK